MKKYSNSSSNFNPNMSNLIHLYQPERGKKKKKKKKTIVVEGKKKNKERKKKFAHLYHG